MTNHHIQGGDRVNVRAEAIMRELLEMTRTLSRQGYGRTKSRVQA